MGMNVTRRARTVELYSAVTLIYGLARQGFFFPQLFWTLIPFADEVGVARAREEEIQQHNVAWLSWKGTLHCSYGRRNRKK